MSAASMRPGDSVGRQGARMTEIDTAQRRLQPQAADRSEPETCTVELSTGSFVMLAHPPSAVLGARNEYGAAARDLAMSAISPIRGFQRVQGSGLTGWSQVWIDVTQVVAVYPIGGRPEYPAFYSVITAGGFVPPGS